MLTILADENIPAVEHYFGSLGTVHRVSGRGLQSSQLAGVDVLLVRSVTAVDEALLAGSGVRFVGTATSGLDHIDRDYLARAGIGFGYAPGSNANSVVEYVLSAIAALDDRLERIIAGGCVGIIGYGVIGRALAARLHSLGIQYLAYDPWLAPGAIDQPATLAQILSCDVITLHAELTRESPWPSYHLLDEDLLAQVNSNSLLINASRGPVVDNQALLTLLSTGAGPATVLDVWETEPAIDHALLTQVQLGTAHIAGYSLDGKLLATRMLCQAMTDQMGLSWQAPQSPAGKPPALAVPADLHGVALVRHLLLSRYDIRRDDGALRGATLGRAGTAAAANFDLLRRHYQERRELLGSLVQGHSLSPRDLELITGLGCISSGAGDAL